MSIYDIHFCKYDELPELQEFIDKHWRKGHILSYSKELFEFQHKLPGKDYYSFVVAKNIETSEIDAVYGYIETQIYDASHTIPNIGWGAIWKVRDDVQNKEIGKLGLKLLKFILKNSDIETFAALGISKTHKDIAISLNCKVGETEHYYIVNNRVSNFIVAKNPDTTIKSPMGEQLELAQVDDIEGYYLAKNDNPFKNISYFIGRYQKHPFFKYNFWLVKSNEELDAIFVVRKIKVLGSYIFRVIDFIGSVPEVKSIYNAVQQILNSNDAEYVDCINAGLPKSMFENLGFSVAPHDDTVVIPEHLDPLEHKYVPLEYEYMDEDMKLIIFKGDGDQDRPNKV